MTAAALQALVDRAIATGSEFTVSNADVLTVFAITNLKGCGVREDGDDVIITPSNISRSPHSQGLRAAEVALAIARA